MCIVHHLRTVNTAQDDEILQKSQTRGMALKLAKRNRTTDSQTVMVNDDVSAWVSC